MKRSFSALYFSVRAIMCVRRLETRVPLHEQGACCEQRPAALKRLLTCSAPAANSALLCPAKLHCNQLVAIFNYNTWAALTRQPRPWKPAGALVGGGEEVQGGGKPRWCLWTRFGSCQREWSCFINLLLCRLLFPLCGNWRLAVSNGAYRPVKWMNDKKNNRAFITAFKNDGCAASTVKTVDVLIFHWSHKTFM